MTSQAEWYALIDKETDVQPPSYMTKGEILNRPDTDNPAPMRVHDLAFKGYVECWDTKTGRYLQQPRWLLWQTMSKVREDGSPVFTLTDPKIPPNYGADLKCMLNPGSPEYPYLASMGFQPCRKQHIPHQDALMRHVKKSHSRAWEAIEMDRARREREEDRQLQRDMLQAMTQAAVKGVTERDNGVITETAPEAPVVDVQTFTTFAGEIGVDRLEVDLTEPEKPKPRKRNREHAFCPDCSWKSKSPGTRAQRTMWLEKHLLKHRKNYKEE